MQFNNNTTLSPKRNPDDRGLCWCNVSSRALGATIETSSWCDPHSSHRRPTPRGARAPSTSSKNSGPTSTSAYRDGTARPECNGYPNGTDRLLLSWPGACYRTESIQRRRFLPLTWSGFLRNPGHSTCEHEQPLGGEHPRQQVELNGLYLHL